MQLFQAPLFRYCVIAVCSAIMASGCIIERRSLMGPGYGQVAPRQYCPGDTMTASFDFLQEMRCPAGVDCTAFLPTVAMNSDEGMLFPPQSIRGYTGTFNFVAPDIARLGVLFDPNVDEVLIPTETFRDGNRVFFARPSTNLVATASRQSPLDQTLVHDGMCAGAAAVNAPQELPGLPQFSPNLRLTDLCNANSVSVIATLSGGADGTTYTQMLSPGQCLSGMPGVPAGTQSARMVDVRPAIADPNTRCTATGPNMPPPPLRMRARMACGV
jgi:hypothetical protein